MSSMEGGNAPADGGDDAAGEIKRGWGHKLFGCLDNPGVCVATAFAPCYTFGTVSAVLGRNCCLMAFAYTIPGLNCLFQFRQRKELRAKRKINDAGGDLVPVLCCWSCALCQEANEARDMVLEHMQKKQEEQEQEKLLQQQSNKEIRIVIVEQPARSAEPQHQADDQQAPTAPILTESKEEQP